MSNNCLKYFNEKPNVILEVDTSAIGLGVALQQWPECNGWETISDQGLQAIAYAPTPKSPMAWWCANIECKRLAIFST